MFTKELEGFWEPDHYAIDRGNAAQLFPQVRQKDIVTLHSVFLIFELRRPRRIDRTDTPPRRGGLPTDYRVEHQLAAYLRFIACAGFVPSAGLATAAGVFVACAGFLPSAGLATAAGVIVAGAAFFPSVD